jgi:hypothetical protein
LESRLQSRFKKLASGADVKGLTTEGDLRRAVQQKKKKKYVFSVSDEGNENVTTLFNILTTYALNHPAVGYCQVGSSALPT